MALIVEASSSTVRPVIRGRLGAVSAAHPLAVAAGQEMLAQGGNAVDAAIAAQACLCVIMPDACGLGGDMLALVRPPAGATFAVNGTGASPKRMAAAATDGAGSITVPGIVDAWCTLSSGSGRLPLARALEPALRLARDGVRVSASLARALQSQRARLERGGARNWVMFGREAGSVVKQPALAALLARIGDAGRDAFYAGDGATAIAATVQSLGGTLGKDDLAAHATVIAPPLAVGWGDWQILVQPPITQGVLLAMSIQAFARLRDVPLTLDDHVAIELTQSAFAHRDDVAEGEALLAQPLSVDLEKASNRGGPRAYLHTAGVAVADRDGMVVSSLVSVFDYFGSCVYVPALGITLNDRAAGFTQGANAAAPDKRPVHTLAPAMLELPDGVVALATPGADGQVQTLLQVLVGVRRQGLDLARAIARPRWRSESGRLLIERGHSGQAELTRRGHRVAVLDDGDDRFGAVVCAGVLDGPFAAADWRRETTAGVA